MTQNIFGVKAGSEEYSHELVLSHGGKRIGFHLANGVEDIRPIPPRRQPPAFPISQNSWHAGRGIETWQPNQFGYYDAKDMWTTTPNKLHPQLLTQWATGMRDAESEMPNINPTYGGTYTWRPLYTNGDGSVASRYLAVSFVASATSNRERSFLIIRRKVPAGVTDAPGTLTVEWCTDNAGVPGTVQKTVTKTYDDATDTRSYVMEFKPSSVLAVTSGTTYWIKIYGASTDSQSSCWEVLTNAQGSQNGWSTKYSTNGTSWTTTSQFLYFRITDADVNRRIFFFTLAGMTYAVDSKPTGAASQLWIHGVRGRATSGTTSALTDTGAGQYAGTFPTMTNWYMRITKGTGFGQIRIIASNTATAITPTIAFDIAPDSTSEYICYHPTARWKEITGHGLGIVFSKPVYANGTIYFPQGDQTDIRIMRIDYAQASDHAFDAENTNHNQATLLNAETIDGVRGAQMWRTNNLATAAGTPAGLLVSAGQGDTSPASVALPFGTDITFQSSILMGDNTYSITGLYSHDNQIYVAKEDLLYTISNKTPVAYKYGADASPSIFNGITACTGMDGGFYIAANHDIVQISGRSAVPLRMNSNLPATRAGYPRDMTSVLGWMFVALDAGTGESSVMKFSFDTRTWSEQMRAPLSNRSIRSVAWETGAFASPVLLVECGGEVLFQQFPINGTRPIQDSSVAYTWEGVIEFPTIDLLNTNPKYFSTLELHAKNLSEYESEVAFEYQLDNKIGTTEWQAGGFFTTSPLSRIQISKGSQHKIRIRLRINNKYSISATPLVENVTLTLFERYQFNREWMVNIRLGEDEDVSGLDMYEWLINATSKAEAIYCESIFKPLDKKKIALTLEPNFSLETLAEDGIEATAQLILSEVIE